MTRQMSKLFLSRFSAGTVVKSPSCEASYLNLINELLMALQVYGCGLTRNFSSELFPRNPNPVDLDYAAHIPPDGNKQERALVILHGLLQVSNFFPTNYTLIFLSGSKRNFTSLSKVFMKDLNIPVYALVSGFVL